MLGGRGTWPSLPPHSRVNGHRDTPTLNSGWKSMHLLVLLAPHLWASLSKSPVHLLKHIQKQSPYLHTNTCYTHTQQPCLHVSHTQRCHHTDRCPHPPESPSSSHTRTLTGMQTHTDGVWGYDNNTHSQSISPGTYRHTCSQECTWMVQAHPDAHGRGCHRGFHSPSQTHAHLQHPRPK